MTSLRDREQSHEQNRLWGGLQRLSSIFKRLTLQSKIPGSCTYALNDILITLCIVGRDNRRRSQKNRTTSLSGREQSHDQNQSRGGFWTRLVLSPYTYIKKILILMKNNDSLFSDIQNLCNAVSDWLIQKINSPFETNETISCACCHIVCDNSGTS